MKAYDFTAALRETVTTAPLPQSLRLNRPKTLDLLRGWLGSHPDNRLAYSAYLRLWARRRGLPLSHGKKPTLKPALYTKLVEADPHLSTNYLTPRFAGALELPPPFWSLPKRLEASLEFMRLDAAQVLVDLAGYGSDHFPAWVPLPYPVEALHLADSFWQPPAHLYHIVVYDPEGMRLFAVFLDEEGYLGLEARRVLTDSLMLEGETSRNNATKRLSLLLSSRKAGWDLDQLDTLARANGMSVAALGKAYVAWVRAI